MENFGSRLKTLRVSSGFKTAREVAALLGVSENAYARYESGRVAPRLGLIADICRVLRVTPNDLFLLPSGDPRDWLNFTTMSGKGFGESATPLGLERQAALRKAPAAMPASVLPGDQRAHHLDMLRWQLANEFALGKLWRRSSKASRAPAIGVTQRAAAEIYGQLVQAPIAPVTDFLIGAEFKLLPAKSRVRLNTLIEDYFAHLGAINKPKIQLSRKRKRAAPG